MSGLSHGHGKLIAESGGARARELQKGPRKGKEELPKQVAIWNSLRWSGTKKEHHNGSLDKHN